MNESSKNRRIEFGSGRSESFVSPSVSLSTRSNAAASSTGGSPAASSADVAYASSADAADPTATVIAVLIARAFTL